MEDKILNLNLYKEELRNHYNSILHNRILLMQPLSWSDEELYAKYGISVEEIAFIDSMIRPMDLNGGDDDA